MVPPSLVSPNGPVSALSPWGVHADSPGISASHRAGVVLRCLQHSWGREGWWEGQVQNLLDNLGTDTVGKSWIGKRVGQEWKSFLLPHLPLRGFLEKPLEMRCVGRGRDGAWKAAVRRKQVEIRPAGKEWESETPTQDPLSGICRCAASHDVTTEPAHSGDPVQPHTAGLSLLRVPHPYTPMVSPRRPGLPSRGHLSHSPFVMPICP